MTSTSVLLSESGPVDAIVGLLTDWSAAGLLAPFVVVNAADVREGPIPALRVHRGVAHGGFLQGFLADSGDSLIRLCSLVPAFSLDGAVAPSLLPSAEPGLLRAVQNMRNVPTTQVRCIVARGGGNDVPIELARLGWHNIIVSPEESSGPRQGVVPLAESLDALAMAQPAAAAVAALAGLWSGVAAGPLDDQMPSASGHPKLMRAQARWLDASALEAHLRERTLETAANPLPQGISQVAYIDDAEVAAVDMARVVTSRHKGAFKSGRQAAEEGAVQDIGAWAAFKMFFGFLASSLRSAPGEWFRRVMDGVSSQVADRFQRSLFGSGDSRYRVVVGTSWRRMSWADVTELTTGMEQELQGEFGARRHEAAPDFSPVWRDYVDGALTLLDAGDRGTPPITVGSGLGVLREARLAVPPADEDFRDVPGDVRVATGVAEVEPFNWRDQEILQAALVEAGEEKASSSTAADELRAWRASVRPTYVAQVGAELGGWIAGLVAEVGSLTAEITNAATPPGREELLAQVRRTASRVRWLFIIALLLLVGGALLGALSVVSWAIAGAIMGGIVVSWLISSIVVFTRGQQALFAEINRRRVLVSKAEANVANWQAATRDLKRGIQGYEQFLQWSRALRAVVNEPFGHTVTAQPLRAAGLEGLPQNVRWGRGVADEDRVRSVLVALRQRLYRIGWLGPVWDAVLADAPGRLGPEAARLAEDPRRLFNERAGVSESLLDPWVTSLSTGVGREAGDAAWAALRADGRAEVWRSAATVSSLGANQGVDAFLNDLGAENGGPPFDSRLLNDVARSHNAQRVDGQPWVSRFEGEAALGVVRVELSPAIDPTWLSIQKPGIDDGDGPPVVLNDAEWLL